MMIKKYGTILHMLPIALQSTINLHSDVDVDFLSSLGASNLGGGFL